MSSFSGFISGLNSYRRASSIIFKHNIWIYCIVSVVVFGSIFYFGFEIQKLSWLYSAKEAGDNYFLKIWYLIVKAFYEMLALAMINLTKYFMLMVLSPILAIISERVENILTGNKYDLSIPQLIKDVKRAIKLALRNLINEMLYIGLTTIIILIIEKITGLNLNWVSWIALTLIGAYYYGFSFMDYANERRRLNIKESVKFIKQHKGVTIAIGLVFSLIYNDLFLLFESNFRIIAFLAAAAVSMTPIFAVVAATVVVDDLVDLSKNEFAKKKAVDAEHQPQINQSSSDVDSDK